MEKKQKLFTFKSVLSLLAIILVVFLIIYLSNMGQPGTSISISEAQYLVETGLVAKKDKNKEYVLDADGKQVYEDVGRVANIYVLNGSGYIRLLKTDIKSNKFPKNANYNFTYNNTTADLNFIRVFNEKIKYAKDYRVKNPTGDITYTIDGTTYNITGYETYQIINFQQANPTASFIEQIFPYLSIGVMAIIAFFIIRMFVGKNNGSMSFGKSKAKLFQKSNIRFSDVAGADEEKEETAELVEFLKDSTKFKKLGARIPKGVLLVGPPGTGKTLLAKAVAGESDVPFFSISGSDFVELYVGVGASRVRDLFDTAKKNAPCIIFIDEIDAVGRQRGAGMGGGNDEREQTLNQLLVEMDGFENNEGIIVLAATNRSDVLDPALLRPGRFDRQICVNPPDVKGREGIIKIHSKNKPLDPSINLTEIARLITGFTGADIENFLNEAAILAARKGKTIITMEDLTEGINKVLMGPQKKSRLVTPKDRLLTAYHESGHAIISNLLDCGDKVHEVSIIPRGMAGGYTSTRPSDDDSHYSLSKLNNRISMMMGGRVAEELIFKDITAGASSDIQKATEIARKMVVEWGMSEKLGFLNFGKSAEVFIGRDYQTQVNYSEDTASMIDHEIKNIIDSNYKKTKELLESNLLILDNMAKLLLEKETIYNDEVVDIMKGADYKSVAKRLDKKNKEQAKKENEIILKQRLEEIDKQKKLKNQISDALFKDGVISSSELERIKQDNDKIFDEQKQELSNKYNNIEKESSDVKKSKDGKSDDVKKAKDEKSGDVKKSKDEKSGDEKKSKDEKSINNEIKPSIATNKESNKKVGKPVKKENKSKTSKKEKTDNPDDKNKPSKSDDKK